MKEKKRLKKALREEKEESYFLRMQLMDAYKRIEELNKRTVEIKINEEINLLVKDADDTLIYEAATQLQVLEVEMPSTGTSINDKPTKYITIKGTVLQ